RALQNRMEDGPHEGDLARSGDRRERSDLGGRRYRYFPRETVRMDLLLVAPKTQSDLVCPNGVQFYDVTDGAAQSRRAAWSYEAPGTGMQQVDHWISFWEDVEIK